VEETSTAIVHALRRLVEALGAAITGLGALLAPAAPGFGAESGA
jgi:hypothetical protein